MHRTTDGIPHPPILVWRDITLSLKSHGSLNDITQRVFFLEFVSCSITGLKTYRFKFRHCIIKENQHSANLPFRSINVPFKNTIQLKTCLWTFCHSNHIEKTITCYVSNGLNIRFVRRVLWVHRRFKISLQFVDPQSDHRVLLNFLKDCMAILYVG